MSLAFQPNEPFGVLATIVDEQAVPVGRIELLRNLRVVVAFDAPQWQHLQETLDEGMLDFGADHVLRHTTAEACLPLTTVLDTLTGSVLRLDVAPDASHQHHLAAYCASLQPGRQSRKHSSVLAELKVAYPIEDGDDT